MINKTEYQTISIPKDCIPKGGQLIEAYETETHFIILGDPSDEPEGLSEAEIEQWYETAHSCDAMGCGTLSHVLYRIPKTMLREDGSFNLEPTIAALVTERDNARAQLSIIRNCAQNRMNDAPHFPCRVDEMTEREGEISNVCAHFAGALAFIAENVNEKYVPTVVDALRSRIDSLETDIASKKRLLPSLIQEGKLIELQRAMEAEAEAARLRSENEVLVAALRPFAEMDRADCNLNEVACRRGAASDLTIITSGDFRRAAEALAPSSSARDERGEGRKE